MTKDENVQKISAGTINAIRQMIAAGDSALYISMKLRVSKQTVYKYGYGKMPIAEQDNHTKISEWWFQKINQQNKLLKVTFDTLKIGSIAKLLYRKYKKNNHFVDRKIEGKVIHKDGFKIIIEINPWTRECWTRNDFMCGAIRLNK